MVWKKVLYSGRIPAGYVAGVYQLRPRMSMFQRQYQDMTIHVPLASPVMTITTRQYQPVAIDSDVPLAAFATTVLVPTIANHDE